MTCSRASGESGLGHTHLEKWEGMEEANVKSITLDAYCLDEVESLNLIKMNIEGGELKALRGGRETPRRSYPDLLTEVHLNRLGKKSCKSY